MAKHLLASAIRFARRGFWIVLQVLVLGASLGTVHAAGQIDMQGVSASDDVHVVADWLMRYRVNKGKPFIIADKVNSALYAFDAKGKLLGTSPALFGAARSDVLTAAQAAKKIEDTLDADKVTPAGVFAAEGYRSPSYGESVWFTGYKSTNLLIHRAFNAERVKRLQTDTTADNRMTYGCINASPEFVDNVLVPHFSGKSTVMVLPEKQSAKAYFALDDAPHAGRSFLASFWRLIDAYRPRTESGPRDANRIRRDPEDAPTPAAGEVASSSRRSPG